MPTANSNMANFTPTNADFSITHMLANTFGDVTGNIFGTGSNAANFANVLGTAFAYFNSAVLFFGTVILAYVTIFGVMNTANDGQALGRKWSTMMTPLRIAGSAAALIPTTSGYSIIQLIVLQVVVWGVGIADTTWTNVVAASLTKTLPNSFVALEGDQNTVRKLAGDVLLAKVCAHTLNQTLGQVTGGATNISAVQRDEQMNVGMYNIKRTVYEFKDTAAQPAGNGGPICGSIAFELKTTSSTVPAATSPVAQAQRDEAVFSAQQTQAIANAMVVNFSGAAYNALDQKLEVLKNQIVATGATPTAVDASLFQQAINDYLSVLKNGYASSITNLNNSSPILKDFLQTTTQRGWVQAGMFHRRLSQIQSALKDAYRITPQSESPSQSLIEKTAPALDPGFLNYYATSMQKANAAIRDGQATWESQPANQGHVPVGFPSLSFGSPTSDPTSIWEKWVSGIGQKVVAGVVDLVSVPDTNGWTDPVLQIKDLGDYTMTAGEILIAAEKTVKIALAWGNVVGSAASSNVVGQVVGVDGVRKATYDALVVTVTELAELIKPSAYGLLYTGYFMSIFLPMVPFMVFMLAVVGWLIAVVESVVAAPLWMVMHMTPESNDSFIGSQQQGYMLLLSVFFKPILTVLGLLLSLIMLRPIMDLVNMGFIGSMVSLQSNSVTGLGSIFGYLLVYAFITLAVFMTVFALPQDMSDRVLKWISAGIGSLGEKDAMHKIEGGASGMAREGLRSAQMRQQQSNSRLAEAIAARREKGKTDQPAGGGSGATAPSRA
jgi:conjugal transfer/type IV secretion protein DotA/TraY